MNTININDYILTDETNACKGTIWLHNLPNDETLFDVIDKLREVHKEETLVFTEEIKIIEKTIDKEVNFSNCIFQEDVNFSGCIFEAKLTFSNCKFKKEVNFEETNIRRSFNIEETCFYEKVLLKKSILKFEPNDKIEEIAAPWAATFSNTSFKNVFDCEKTSFKKVLFENVSFERSSYFNGNFNEVNFNNTYFNNTKFDRYPDENSKIENIFFKNTIFEDNTYFNVLFRGETNFLNCVFNPNPNPILNHIPNNNLELNISYFTTFRLPPYDELSFSGSTFEGETNFTGSKFNVETTFSSSNHLDKACLFKDNANFKDCSFSQETNFSEVIFEADTDFSRSTFSVISFQGAIFYQNVRFHQSIFKNNVDFFDTSFKKMVKFYLSEFYEAQQFHTTDFLDRAIFSNTIFYREAQFLYNKVENNSYINFESAIFKRGLDISRSNFNCNLNFWNTTIEEDGEDYIFKNIDDIKYKNDFEAHNEVPSIYKQLRETYRIIKDNSYKQNNKIEALEFSKKEMLVYERELKSVSSKSNNDKLLLLANKISNNFGTNWLRGILFTASAGIITYLLMLCCLPFIHNTYIFISFTSIIIIISAFSFLNKDIDSFLPILILIILSFLLTIILFKSPFVYKENICIKDYIIPDFIKILNVIDLKPFEKEENSIFNLSSLSYLFLFIGRIFIGYGYYQTIQAFRKFGKS